MSLIDDLLSLIAQHKTSEIQSILHEYFNAGRMHFYTSEASQELKDEAITHSWKGEITTYELEQMLCGAVASKNIEAVMLLLAEPYNTDPGTRVYQQNQAVLTALEGNKLKIARLLLSTSKVDLDAEVIYGGWPILRHLTRWIEEGKVTLKTLRFFMRYKPSCNHIAPGCTPITWPDTAAVTRILVKHGADVNYVLTDFMGKESVLESAIKNCYIGRQSAEKVFYLLKCGALFSDNTIRIAAQYGCIDGLRALFEYGAIKDLPPEQVQAVRDVLGASHPTMVVAYDKAVTLAHQTITHNKLVLSQSLFYLCAVRGYSSIGDGPISVIVEYVGFFGERMDTREVLILKALYEGRGSRSTAEPPRKMLRIDQKPADAVSADVEMEDASSPVIVNIYDLFVKSIFDAGNSLNEKLSLAVSFIHEMLDAISAKTQTEEDEQQLDLQLAIVADLNSLGAAFPIFLPTHPGGGPQDDGDTSSGYAGGALPKDSDTPNPLITSTSLSGDISNGTATSYYNAYQ